MTKATLLTLNKPEVSLLEKVINKNIANILTTLERFINSKRTV